MSRPETFEDIEAEDVQFASIELDKIATNPTILRGYTAFIEAATKAIKAAAVQAAPVYLNLDASIAKAAEIVFEAARNSHT